MCDKKHVIVLESLKYGSGLVKTRPLLEQLQIFYQLLISFDRSSLHFPSRLINYPVTNCHHQRRVANCLRESHEQKLNNFHFTVAENGLLVWQLDFVTMLFLVLVGYEAERKKSHIAQLDTQLISNILKQVCMCGLTLILNSCVVYVVHSGIVTNSICLLQQLTSPAWAFAFLAFRSW